MTKNNRITRIKRISNKVILKCNNIKGICFSSIFH